MHIAVKHRPSWKVCLQKSIIQTSAWDFWDKKSLTEPQVYWQSSSSYKDTSGATQSDVDTVDEQKKMHDFRSIQYLFINVLKESWKAKDSYPIDVFDNT